MASSRRFVLVPKGCGNGVTNMDKERINGLTENNFPKEWDAAHTYIQRKGACEAVIHYHKGNGEWGWYWTRNTPKLYHAEENLFRKLDATTLTVKAVLITTEPCRGGRYGNGHNCYELFHKGRVVGGKLCKFIAAEPDTPVFYLQDQPAPEEKSTISSELARVNKSVMMESLANLGGPPYGQVSMPSTNKDI